MLGSAHKCVIMHTLQHRLQPFDNASGGPKDAITVISQVNHEGMLIDQLS